MAIVTASVAGSQTRSQKVWDIPEGKACFERWIGTYTSTLNSHNGSDRFNRMKPYGISPCGHKTYRQMVSARAPG